MATKYNLFVDGTAVTDATRAKKEPVIKIGEATGKPFEVRTDNGTVVHEHRLVLVKPAKPAPKPKPAVEDDEEGEKPMTKGEAYAWFKRSRGGLRDAERAIEKGNAKQEDVTAWLNDSMGAISELLAAFDETGNGVNGVL